MTIRTLEPPLDMGVQTRSPLWKYWLTVLVLTCGTIASALFLLGTPPHEGLRRFSVVVESGAPRCAAHDAINELESKWGDVALGMSLAHGGSGARLHRALGRMRKRKKIVIGVIGGSITFGHGLKADEKTWATLLEEGLQRVYPDIEIIVHKGAVPATGTDYFSSCYVHHVPHDSDLFVVEAAVNDLVVEDLGGSKGSLRQPDIIDYTERLVREVHASPQEPALVMLSTWGKPHGYINGADRHAVVSEYYDVPRVSMRSFLYPYLLQYPKESKRFWNEKMDHPVQGGHEYLADILLYYILTQSCVEENLTRTKPYPGFQGSNLHSSLDPFTLPRLHIKQHLDNLPFSNPRPFCLSTNVRMDGQAQLQPSHRAGWDATVWNDKHYWTSTTPGSTITFSDIHVQGGSISLYYLRSATYGLGNMRCWADDDVHNAVTLQGYWVYVNVGSTGLVADGLQPGTHTVTCVVLEEREDHNGIKGTNTVHIIAVLAS